MKYKIVLTEQADTDLRGIYEYIAFTLLEPGITAKQIGVTINDLTFGYDKENLIEQANVQFAPSDFIAVMGESGVGKTSLVRLIMSFVKPSDGNILFQLGNGKFEKANANMRDLISYVPQGNTLFSGTIRENIAMGKLDATDDDIVEALINASCFDFVKELPNGLSTVIGEKGLGLSEGQAQRISIARALVRKTPFLILDEATSALDENTEMKVLQQIQKIFPKPTCLIITHRRSVLKYCNHEIYIMDKKINKPKIVKLEKPEILSVELTPEQQEIKEKFLEIDQKINSLDEVLSTIADENPETIFGEEVVANIIGLSAITAASKIISEYFGLKDVNLNDLL
jgi:ABC-type multidrug transport system fused ATPase/permease subunit